MSTESFIESKAEINALQILLTVRYIYTDKIEIIIFESDDSSFMIVFVVIKTIRYRYRFDTCEYGCAAVSLLLGRIEIPLVSWQHDIYIFLFEQEIKDAKPNSTLYIVYASIVMILGIAVGAADFGGNWIAKMIAVAGTLSFAFSDALVIIRQTKDTGEEEKRDDDLLIMITYIGANILLLSSISLLDVMAL